MIPLLSKRYLDFPKPSKALEQPNGLLAIGGDLSPERLYYAYQQGIFPWFEPGDEILWWSPNPRIGLELDQLHIPKSIAKLKRQEKFTLTLNYDFAAVISACAQLRAGETWISQEMIEAYCQLHKAGDAHSIEVWSGQRLVGGLYGVAVGQVFCGESMFHIQSNASKFAFYYFAEYFKSQGGLFIDGQVENPHLLSLGMQNYSRNDFIKRLNSATAPLNDECWALKRLC